MSMRYTAHGGSSVGKRRTNNEDAFLISKDAPLFVVADGMGGHSGGEIASHLVVAACAQFGRICLDTRANPVDVITAILAGADNIVRQVGAEKPASTTLKLPKSPTLDLSRSLPGVMPDVHGMGTTVVVVLLDGKTQGTVIHAGDSRAYHFRGLGTANVTITQLTSDHDMATTAKLDPIEYPQAKHTLVNAIGIRSAVAQLAVCKTPILIPGDVLLLCSDGLTNEVSDQKIAEILSSKHRATTDKAVAALLDAANRAGGKDNITCIVVKL